MAEGILFTIASEILMKLSSETSQQLGMIWGLEDDLKKLQSNVSSIHAVLLDVEERPNKSHSLKDWLEKLGDALYDADNVLDELSGMTTEKNAKQVRIFFARSNQLAFNYRMAREIKKIWERLDVINKERENFHLKEQSEPKKQYDLSHQIEMKRKTYSSSKGEEMFGRVDDKRDLRDLLLDTNAKELFIAIVGMGGIGKTTLAKFLYNDSEVSNCFELKMWVWVYEQFELKILVEKILESATGSKPDAQEMDSLQCELQKVIQGKKYLLVMDDIWNDSEEEWRKLKNLLMVGARGSKIIITKRDKIAVAEVESMTKTITLRGLDDESSLSLFRDVAFKEGKEPANSNFMQLGKKILVKCGGIPLIIRHIGRLLYFKTSEEEWMSFMNNEFLGSRTNIQKNDIDPMSILELSYNHLSPSLKQCFAYSSLFPKGKETEINELIKQWMAQGFIESSNGGKAMEDIGKDYFKELCWRFFYENSSAECNFNGSFVRMHDVMRELSKKVAGKKLYVRGNCNNGYVVSEQTRHISFDYKIESWSDVLSKLRKAKGLRMFLLLLSDHKKRNEINKKVLDKLFSSFPHLRVLGLDDSAINTLPNSIKKLKQLRYLDLSENNGIELLPNSITELQNLQTLKLTNCYKLKKLPRDTSNLVNLRHMDFHFRKIIHMPEGMEKLITCLQTISSLVLDCKRLNKLSDQLNELNHIRGEVLRIIGLEQLRRTSFDFSSVKLLKDKKGFRNLILEWNEGRDECEVANGGDESIMEVLEPHPNVEFLKIYGCSGVRSLPNWVSYSPLKLTGIEIVKCQRLQHLPPFHHLQSLQSLYLENLKCVKFIDESDPYSSSSSMFFPSLGSLWLKNMPNLEGWWELRGKTSQNKWLPPTFPQLIVVEIYRCPKLTSMPKLVSSMGGAADVTLCDVGAQTVSSIGPLPSMSSLVLREIKDLKYLPIEFKKGLPPCLSELKIINCPNLKSLPEGIMRQLKSSISLHIEGCPELQQRRQLKERIGLCFARPCC